MIGRLRVLLERPLDPEVARQVVLLAMVVTVGLACLVAASVREDGQAAGDHPATAPTEGVGQPERAAPRPAGPSGAARRQDPQDRPGTSAHGRAERELETHRALQHVPWRHGGVSVTLVGARDGRAVLEVRAPSTAAARRGWAWFLRRFDDPGRAYLPRLRAESGPRPIQPTQAHLRATPEARLRARPPATPISPPSGGSPHHTGESRGRNLPRSPRHTKADR
ncbi:MAG: hypothetical protein JST53_14750 [Actinobacteria bacterium]|nr:hypothetical protein [Actinomycetota bacterium]